MDVFNILRFTIIFLFFMNSSAAIQLVKSSPYAVQGESYTISCHGPTQLIVVCQLSSQHSTSIIGATRDNKCSIAGTYNMDLVYSCACSVTSCTYNVTIPGKHMSKDLHMKIFKFTAYTPTSVVKEIFLSVYVPITNVYIIPNTTGIAVGTIQPFNCTTDAGRPTANIQWYLSDGKNLTEPASQTVCNRPCDKEVQAASSVLMYTGKKDDNNKSIYCNASNVDGRSKRSNDVVVNIWYGPNSVVLSPSNTFITVTETEGSVGPITCTADCIPNCTMTWNGPNLSGGTVSVLNIQNISRNQDGDYNCTASNSVGTMTSNNIKINVLYGPNAVFLSPSILSYMVNENIGIAKPITCSADCRPNCTMTWMGPYPLVGTSSVLDLQNITRNQTGDYVCTASNNISSMPSGIVSVIVNYGPDVITFEPSTTTYMTNETTGGIGPITCIAYCRPNCTMTWSGPNLRDGTTNLLTIKNITRNQTGDYLCTANNTAGSLTSGRVEVIVNYRPYVVVVSPSDSIYTVSETTGSIGPIICTADCRPTCTIIWSGPTLLDGTPSELLLQNITRNQTGEYLCTASNMIGIMTSHKVTVNVNYGPTIVLLTPPTLSYTVTENSGSVGPINCTADCRPKCKMTWSGPNLPDGTVSVLYLQNITRNQAGDYRCHANNSIGNQESLIRTVNVYYAPTILGIEGNTTYYEHATAELRCYVDSIPKAFIKWSFVDIGTVLKLQTDGNRSNQVNNNSLKISPMNCLSMGIYSCVANNSIGITRMERKVTVMCEPRLNTVEYVFQPLVTVSDNEPLNITSPLIAYPTPRIFWQRILNDSVINITRKIVNTNVSNRHFSSLFIQNMTEDDFGFYAIYAGNGIGTNTHICTYEVQAARRPNKPSNVTCSVGHNYIIVNWQPEFDGGRPQTFRVLYKPYLQNLFIEHHENLREADYHPVKIAYLQPSSVYVLKVHTENFYNSEESDEIYCNTTEQEDTKSKSIVAVAIGAGMGSAIAIICVVLTILFVLRRLRTETSKNDKEPIKRYNGEEENEGLEDNPLYVSSGDDDVQQSAIYGKVSKVTKQGKINKPIEMGCVYENHEDFTKGNDQIYANQQVHGNKTKEYNPSKNKDGLIYADLDLASVSTERSFIIRGIENRNNYAIIDLNKKADPLPFDNEYEEKELEEKET